MIENADKLTQDDKATRGLEARFNVEKINDPDGKHADCRYFVLDPQHDHLARRALLLYSELAAQDGQDQLALDIIEWVGQAELQDARPSPTASELDFRVAEIREARKAEALEREQGDGSPAPKKDYLCPSHGIPDCSPLLNGCSYFTAKAGAARQDFPMEGVENKGGFGTTFDQDGKRI